MVCVQSTERPSIRTGVPVFIRPTSKPRSRSCSLTPCEAGSAQRPPSIMVRPTCISPLRKVPLVSTTAFALKVAPSAVLTPTTRGRESSGPSPSAKLAILATLASICPSSKISSVTESCQRLRFSVFSRIWRHISEKRMRSLCARGLHMAGPFERLSMRNWMAVRSVTIPIIPPRASISLTI